MVIKKQHITEILIFLLIILSFNFVGLNIDLALTSGFTLTMFIWGFLLLLEVLGDGKIEYPIKSRNLTKSFTFALIAYGALALGNILIQNLIFNAGDVFSLQSAIAGLQTLTFAESATGVLAGNLIFLTIIFGLLIPVLETQALFVRPLEFLLKHIFKVDPQTVSATKNPGPFIGLSLILMALFTIGHLTAKAALGLTAIQPALLTVLLFSAITVYLIFIEKAATAALLLHIIANSVAIIVGLGTLTPILGLSISIGTAFLVIQILKNRRFAVA